MRSLQSELIDKGILQTHRCEVIKVDKNVRKKTKERLTDWELRELMGVNRDTFKRHKGSVRRR